MANTIDDILNPYRSSYGSGSDTWTGTGGNYLGDNNTLMSDNLLGDSGSEMNFLSDQFKLGSTNYDYLSDPNNADAVSKYAQDAYAKDSAAGGSIFGLGGGDGKIFGMDTGKFALGAAQTGLGFLNYFNTKEYNDVQMDAMKQNMALTQEQYDDYKKFKSDTASTYA